MGNAIRNPLRFVEKKVLRPIFGTGASQARKQMQIMQQPQPTYQPDPNLEVALRLMQANNEAAERRLAELRETMRQQEENFQARLRENQETLARMQAQADKLLQDLRSFIEERKIASFEDLKKADQKRFDAVMSLAAQTPSTPLRTPFSVAFLGDTGAGKSSLINRVVGVPGWCREGIAQTTMEVEERVPPNSNISFFDIPGKTDEISYYNASMIGLLKSCQFVGLTVVRTVHEVSDLCMLLDHINVPYVVLVTKMDNQKRDCKYMGEEEKLSGPALDAFIQTKLEEARQQVLQEVSATCKLGNRQPVFRISSRSISDFDWARFIACMFDRLGRGAFLTPTTNP